MDEMTKEQRLHITRLTRIKEDTTSYLYRQSHPFNNYAKSPDHNYRSTDAYGCDANNLVSQFMLKFFVS